MTWAATAVVGAAAVIGAGSSIYASKKASKAQSSAANTAAAASSKATKSTLALNKYIYDTSREDAAPWHEAGVNALKTIKSTLDNPSSYQQSPGYAFRLSEGKKAIERSAAARGGALGGAQLKALTRYGQDYATNDYDNYLNKYFSLAGLGQTANGQMNSAGQSYASKASNAIANGNASLTNALTAQGNAQASNYINTSNALTSGVNSGLNNYLTWKYLAS